MTTVSSAHRPRRIRLVLAAVLGSMLAYIAGRSGSLGWQFFRIAAVLALALGLGWVILRASRRWRGVAVLAAGVLGTATGIGIAAPWTAKTGIGLTSIAGTLGLLAGLGLLVLGFVDLLGSLRGWRRWASAIGLVLVSIIVVFALGVAVAATNVPPTEVGSATPADRGLGYESVTFPATDGVVLSGWYIPSQNGAAVVMLHGAGSTRTGVLDQAVVVAGHGYGVLLFDARGHGDSDGRAMDLGWYGDEDILGAVAHLAGRGDVDPTRIAAIGLSMGGEQAIGAAAAEPRIRGVIAEGATARTADDKAWLSDEFGAQGWLQQRIDDLTFWFTDLLTEAGPPTPLREAARTSQRPMLLIAAGDVEDETLAGRHIQSGSPDTVELWEVAGAGHTQGLDVAPAEWETRVIEFLDKVIGG